jgi:S1-C subfamily serine protease
MFRKFSIILIIATVCAIGYAQQSSSSRIISPMIFEGGSYLGVETAEVTTQNMAKFGLSTVRGVAVEKVAENSPAKQAGVQQGDVIVAINGEEVASIRKLMRIISEIAPDHQAKLTILRNGEEREITATLAKRPMPKFEGGTFNMRLPMPSLSEGSVLQFPIPNLPSSDGEVLVLRGDEDGVTFLNSGRQIGVSVSPLTKQLAAYFGISEGKGLLITEVEENSAAAKAGLKAGDVITEADGKQVSSLLQLLKITAEKKEGDISLTIVRAGSRQTVKVTPTEVKRSNKIIQTPD